MILCAGLGTRLRPLTEECAKPLVPVGDRPALAHIVERLRAAGAGTLVVNAHHRAGDVRAFAAAEGVLVSEEPELLGTAGGVAAAAPLLGEGDVLVWSGDILAGVDVEAVARAHAAGGAEATLVVAPGPAGSGNVGMDEAGCVVRLRQATTRRGEVRGGEFLAVHVVGAALRARLPRSGCMVGDVYLPALRAGASIAAFETGVAWHDIGTLRGYVDANLAWLRTQREGTYVGAGARVAPGVRLVDAVVGDGALVDGEGELARVVVWPGATARAPLADAVVTRGRTVRFS
jgi:mannose-1-phosphate guanylyltransferase